MSNPPTTHTTSITNTASTTNTATTHTASFTVSGMTCGHCVAAVTEEVAKIEGVTSVDVDLVSGAVTVQSTQPLDPQAVTDAVDEAGYSVVS